MGRYERRLFRLARNVTGNHEDAEEVVQNAFIKAFRNLGAFRGDCRFYTWLTRIAVNEGLMKIRGRRSKEVPIHESDDGENPIIPRELHDCQPNPEERYSQKELRRILKTSIGDLDPGYRKVLQLRDVEGLSTEQTARRLDLSLSAVKTRLRRARLKLRNSLDIYGESRKSVQHSCYTFRGPFPDRVPKPITVRRQSKTATRRLRKDFVLWLGTKGVA